MIAQDQRSKMLHLLHWDYILQEILQVWNIDCAVIASLCFQILLIFLAPLRRRSSGIWMTIIIWCAYLLADWTAIYAMGSIVNNAKYTCVDELNDAFAALWAPFMLIHLGGPETITAFSLEDNELWIRHLVRLMVELFAVAYVYYIAGSKAFWVSTLLLFLAGAIKYGERTRSLYLASLRTLKDSIRRRPDAGPNYAQLMEEYSSMKEAQLPAEIVIENEPKRTAVIECKPKRTAGDVDVPIDLPPSTAGDVKAPRNLLPLQVVREGYRFYNIFRGLIVDHMFSFHERDQSREFFCGLKPNDAFKVMEVELNFMYYELFTKMATLHRNCYGYIFRFTCTVLIVAAFPISLSTFPYPDGSHHRDDIPITCALFVGAIVLDLLALIKILFSDWTIAHLKQSKFLHVIHAIHKKTSNQARWSERISQHNLISYSLKERSKWLDSMIDRFGLKSTYNEIWYKDSRHVDGYGLKEFIFYELKEKSQNAQGPSDAKEIWYSRGKGVINHHDNLVSIKNSVINVEYDESVLLWHIATDLLYYTLEDSPNRDEDNKKPNCREICKTLSDYMLYLLIMRPTMMSAVAGISQISFQDTSEEATKFFNKGRSISKEREACEKLLLVNTEVEPSEVKGDMSKSLLFDACILAKDLRTIGQAEMWEMMSRVWLELLCYGAGHCKGNGHAQQLSRGGELITFVWLLMAHFGLGDHFRIEAGHARAKLILDWEQETQAEHHNHV